MIIIRETMPEDVGLLANTMRDDDCLEVSAYGCSPLMALEVSVNNSMLCLTAEHGGAIAAMFGICPNHGFISDRAEVWLLTGKEIENMKKSFMVYSKRVITYFLQFYPVLENFVDARYLRSIHWLAWCGARFDEPVPLGVHGELFLHFTLER